MSQGMPVALWGSCVARVGSRKDGLNVVASMLVLGIVLCLNFLAQSGMWMIIWYFFYFFYTIHRVITRQPVHTRD